MSCCTLIAADKPLPLTAGMTDRFGVCEHSYYRDCVNELGYTIRPYQYELSIGRDELALRQLKAYLTEQFEPGETVELWQLWVGTDPGPFYSWDGSLAEVDLDLLNAFQNPSGQVRDICQSRMTVKI